MLFLSVVVTVKALAALDIYRPPFRAGCMNVTTTVFDAVWPVVDLNVTRTETFSDLRFLSAALARSLNDRFNEYVADPEAFRVAVRTSRPDSVIEPLAGTFTLSFATVPLTLLRPDTLTDADTGVSVTSPSPWNATEPTTGAGADTDGGPWHPSPLHAREGTGSANPPPIRTS
jgi:hypothetical protein